MPEGDLSSSKSKAAAAFTLLSPTPSTTEQPVSCLRRCETSFAPEQQPSASTDNENPNMIFKISYDITMISQSAKSLLLIYYCLSFLDSASISHQVTAWGVFYIGQERCQLLTCAGTSGQSRSAAYTWRAWPASWHHCRGHPPVPEKGKQTWGVWSSFPIVFDLDSCFLIMYEQYLDNTDPKLKNLLCRQNWRLLSLAYTT